MKKFSILYSYSALHFLKLHFIGLAIFVETNHLLQEISEEVVQLKLFSRHGLFLITINLLLRNLAEFLESLEHAKGVMTKWGMHKIVQGFHLLHSLVSHRYFHLSLGFLLIVSCTAEIIHDLQETLEHESLGIHWGILIWGASNFLKGSTAFFNGLKNLRESQLLPKNSWPVLLSAERIFKGPVFNFLIALTLILVALNSIFLEGLSIAEDFLHASYSMIFIGFNEFLNHLALILKSFLSFFHRSAEEPKSINEDNENNEDIDRMAS